MILVSRAATDSDPSTAATSTDVFSVLPSAEAKHPWCAAHPATSAGTSTSPRVSCWGLSPVCSTLVSRISHEGPEWAAGGIGGAHHLGMAKATRSGLDDDPRSTSPEGTEEAVRAVLCQEYEHLERQLQSIVAQSTRDDPIALRVA